MSGCGASNPDQPPLGTVSGTVTLDDQPLPGATVTFTPEDGRTSSGKTDSEGRYELRYTADTLGAKAGEHTVRITTVESSAEAVAAEPEKVPEIYNTNSTLTEVVETGNNTIDFALKSMP